MEEVKLFSRYRIPILVEKKPWKTEKVGGCKKKTHSEYVNELNQLSPNLEVLEKYINAQTPILHKCKMCGTIEKKKPNNVLSGKNCSVCYNNRRSKNQRKTQEQYLNELKILSIEVEPLESYINYSTPILHVFKKCNHKAKVSPANILHGHGCKICKSLNAKERYMMSNDEYMNKLQRINSNIVPLEKYDGMNKKIEHIDLLCKHIFKASPYSILNGGGCKICKMPYGEKIIQNYLDVHHINYIQQYKFSNLIGIKGKKLSYDFYLPKYNLLIEFQGQQHDYSIEYFGGIKTFIKQKIHDTRKRKYCHDNHIHLLEIWYYEINKTEKILEQYLNNLKLETVETTGVA